MLIGVKQNFSTKCIIDQFSKKEKSELFLKENVESTTIRQRQDRILSLRPNEYIIAEFRKFKLLVHLKLVVVKSAETHFD